MRGRPGRESGSPDSGPRACVLREQVTFLVIGVKEEK